MKKDLNAQGQGNSDTKSRNPNNHNRATSEAGENKQHSEAGAPMPRLSAARIRANRNNAKKSTGPKTERGKAYSRRNALKHGLLAKAVLFSADGSPINEELHDLWDGLRHKYGAGDVRTDLLLEGVLVESWRQRMALRFEMKWFDEATWHFGPQGNMANLQRYRIASQHALLKNLELLDESQSSTEDVHDTASDSGKAATPEVDAAPAANEDKSSSTTDKAA